LEGTIGPRLSQACTLRDFAGSASSRLLLGAAGADIVVVTERWYSPELKIQLLARIIDPRAGDTSEVVTNLDRGEPDLSEFQIPADYKIETVVARGKQAERVPHQ
jgi:hypothetical protein